MQLESIDTVVIFLTRLASSGTSLADNDGCGGGERLHTGDPNQIGRVPRSFFSPELVNGRRRQAPLHG
jgi:hypothetical protein